MVPVAASSQPVPTLSSILSWLLLATRGRKAADTWWVASELRTTLSTDTYVSVSVCMHSMCTLYTSMHVHTHACMYMHVACTCIHTCMYTRNFVIVCMWAQVSMHAGVHAHTSNVCVHTCAHMRTSVCLGLPVCMRLHVYRGSQSSWCSVPPSF